MGRRKKVSDELILEVARKTFVEHGPAVPTETIAAELDISPAALLKRFGSKQRLMLESLKPEAEPPWFQMLERGPDGRPFREQLEEFLVMALRFFDAHVPRLAVLRMAAIRPADIRDAFPVPPPVTHLRGIARWLDRCHANGMIRKVNSEAVAMAIMGGLHGRAFLKMVLGDMIMAGDDQSYLREIADLFIIGPDAGSSSSS